MNKRASNGFRKGDRPLSSMQRMLLASQLQHPNAPVQNMVLLAHLDGQVDSQRFVGAFDHVVRMSDALRTRFCRQDDEPIEILSDPPGKTTIIELSHDSVRAWAKSRALRPLDLTVCGYDSVLLQHGDKTATWFLNIHHTLTDATSSALVFQLTAEAYAAKGDRKVCSYYDWAAQSLEDADGIGARAQSFWQSRERMSRINTLYPVDAPTSSVASQVLSPFSDELQKFWENHDRSDTSIGDVSQTALLATALALLIHQVSGETDFSIGLPVSQRNDPAARSCIGVLVEVFPVDIKIEPGEPYSGLRKRISSAVIKTLKNAFPGTSPDPDYAALLNVLPSHVAPDAFGSIPASVQWLHCSAMDPAQALRLHVMPYAEQNFSGSDRFKLALDISNSVANEAYHAQISEAFHSIVIDLLRDPEGQVGEAPICNVAEQALICQWESAPEFPDRPVPLAKLLKSTLKGNSNVVITEGDTSYTGDEIWSWAMAVANAVAQFSKPCLRIGVALDPSVQAVVAIYGIVIAGASFVPLSLSDPEKKRDQLCERAGVVNRFRSTDEIDALRDQSATSKSFSDASEDDEAYLLFTSGSSGQPKGVPISNKGLARYIHFALSTYFEAEPEPVAPLFGALAFDLTLTSLFAPILAGGRLKILSAHGAMAMGEVAEDTTINWCKATPSHLKILTRNQLSEHQLRTLVVGGEAFGMRTVQDLRERIPTIDIFNEYGPTEAVVGCMSYRLPSEIEGTNVLIGRPMPGATLRVVDRYDRRVPTGMAGELLISHPGMMKGYLGETSDGPFVDLEGMRFYRSGDRVRLTPAQELAYLGRNDTQIKVGGHRVDLTEIEQALRRHPAIANAAAGCWVPETGASNNHCPRCGLPDNVPGVVLNDEQFCRTCKEYDRVAPVVRGWFKTEDDLAEKQPVSRAKATGNYDCMHLFSGGKDSTYALYRLVDLGYTPYAFTLDNGYISEQAKDNIRRIVTDLNVDHEFVTTPAMNAIFRDSLAKHSNVCNGCFKTIYTLAANRAYELGIPLIVTGLSRGQLFETRLIPQQFALDRFDPDAIDRAVTNARRSYHRVDDVPNRLLDTKIFHDDQLFKDIEFLDFYRYVDVDLSSMLAYLSVRTPWMRPEDTGRSTNCLINAAGIHTHQLERGYHNYAIPYAWDVRLGHKTRQEAMEELNDDLDIDDVSKMLAEVGYAPSQKQTLTAWIELGEGYDAPPSNAALRGFLGQHLPAYAIPSAFVTVRDFSLTQNGKLEIAALPRPERAHRQSLEPAISNASATQDRIISVWERQLRVEPIGLDDSFFAVGGDSLAALSMIIQLSADFGIQIREDLAFTHVTPRQLSEVIDQVLASKKAIKVTRPIPSIGALSDGQSPQLSAGEQAILIDQKLRSHPRMYSVVRIFEVDGPVDADRFSNALKSAASRHQPLSWTFSTPRKKLLPEDAVECIVHSVPVSKDTLLDAISEFKCHPIDLDHGPLLRCLIQPLLDGTTIVGFSIHHVSGDHESFDNLWQHTLEILAGNDKTKLRSDYASVCAWQIQTKSESARRYWLEHGSRLPAATLLGCKSDIQGRDGYLFQLSSLNSDEIRACAETPVSLIMAATAAGLRPYLSSDEVELGLVASTRDHPDAKPLFGYFLNLLPIRLNYQPEDQIGALTRQAGLAVGRALTHRSYPHTQIMQDRKQQGLCAAPLQVLVAIDDAPQLTLDGNTVSQRSEFNGFSVADITVFLNLNVASVTVGLEYAGRSIDASVAQAMLQKVEASLCQAVRSPSALLSGVETLTENRSVLVGPELQASPQIMDRIWEQVKKQPDAPAVTCDEVTTCWSQIGLWANAVAFYLAAKGIRQGDRVVVSMQRSAYLIGAMLGVLRAGAVYVPIDPNYPIGRIRNVVSVAGAKTAIIDEHSKLVDAVDIHCVTIREDGIENHGWNVPVTPLPIIQDHDVAYLMFTSGSTGVPRGVCITHRQLSDSTNARDLFYDTTPEKFAMLSGISFDSSLVGLFWTLATGGTIILPAERQARDVDALSRLVSNATHALLVPTLYDALLERRDRSKPWPTNVIVAGEACLNVTLAKHYEQVPQSTLFNEYGPTEATIWATASRSTASDASLSAGTPIAGSWSAVVDDDENVLPCGVVGNLVVGGPGVASGYDHSPEETQKRFGFCADHPLFSELPGERYFRTGDLAAIASGQLTYLGRSDDQINIGGARVEPGDIESVLLGTRLVSGAVVTSANTQPLAKLLKTASQEDLAEAMAEASKTDEPSATLAMLLRAKSQTDLQLVAHVETANALDIAALRTLVAAELPSQMRPAHYVVHQTLPRTPNGKLDRALAAKQFDAENAYQNREGPNVADEMSVSDRAALKKLTDLFRQEIGAQDFGPHDSFFAFSGDSMVAVRLVLAIENSFDVQLTTTALYDAPTPEMLIKHLSADKGDEAPIFVIPCDLGYTAPPPEFHAALTEHRLAVYLDHPCMRKGTSPIWTITELAQHYVREIEQRHPDGPILLAAFCIGAFIATEVARILEDKGRAIEHMLLLDPSIPRLQVVRMGLLPTPPKRLNPETRIRQALNVVDKIINSRLLLGEGYLRGSRRRSKAWYATTKLLSFRFLRRLYRLPKHHSMNYWARGLMLASATYDDLTPFMRRVDIIASEQHRPLHNEFSEFLVEMFPDHVIQYVEKTHRDIGLSANTARHVAASFEAAINLAQENKVDTKFHRKDQL